MRLQGFSSSIVTKTNNGFLYPSESADVSELLELRLKSSSV